MDNGLVQLNSQNLKKYIEVLILIVVDNGLVHTAMSARQIADASLNPYCSGQWSRTLSQTVSQTTISCLNPYCSGQWSRTAWDEKRLTRQEGVLILIVVDNGLVQVFEDLGNKVIEVLILIVVDNGLVRFFACGQVTGMVS